MSSNRIFTIEPNPHWVIIDNFSKLPDGAAIYTYRSLDPSTFKPAFQDAAGQIPYGQPIVGFGNGTMPPIFWEFDPDDPTDTYYIRVYDSADTSVQQFLWDFDGLSGGGSGGGGTVVSVQDINNLVVNNIFFRNTGTTTPAPQFQTIAPSNNAGFVGLTASGNGLPSPDATFQKNNATATDSLSFPPFTPVGINALNNNSTPENYVNYTCTVPGSGETFKFIQFPISKGVNSLSQQKVTIRIFARCNSGDPTLTLFWRQFYGDGGGSAETFVDVNAPIALDATWREYIISSTAPDATGKTIGDCGNDGLFLCIQYPLNLATNIDFIKPAIYLGSFANIGTDFVSNDEVDSIVNSPRTGDIKITLDYGVRSFNGVMPGWVIMNDGTIGDATSNATNRANIDTFPLFNLLWQTFQANQAFAPMFTSTGTDPANQVAYGASSIADFTAHRQIALTKMLGRVIQGTTPQSDIETYTTAGNIVTVPVGTSFNTAVPIRSLSGPISTGITYYARRASATTFTVFPTPADAIANTNQVTFANGNGSITTPSHALGEFFGFESLVGQGAGSLPNNILSGTVCMNVFMKL